MKSAQVLAGVLFAIQLNAQSGSVTPLGPLSPIRLQEFRAAPLERPRNISIDPDGGIYVSDLGTSSVLRFSASGEPVKRYGARGDGPGELRVPVATRVLDDSTVAVIDVRRRELNLFNRTTGAFRTRMALSGMPGSITSLGNDVWIGALNVATRQSMLHLALPASTATPSLSVPAAYVEGSPLVAANYEVHPVMIGTQLVVGYSATNRLHMLVSGRVTDSIEIPIRKRRGVPADLNDRLAKISNPADFYSMLSSLIALQPFRSNMLVAGHVDLTVRANATFPPTPGAPDPFAYSLFVSLVRPLDKKVCADISVPVSGAQRPSIAVKGDTLFVLDQDASNDDNPWLIRRFQIREQACTWS